MSIFREFNINMIPGKPPLIIHVSQYESDFVYTFNLVSGKSVLAIPDTAIAVIRGTKRDGNGFSKEVSLDTENNKVVVIGEVQLTACAGRNVFELAILNNEKTICTANFFLDVERAPLDSDTIQSETVLHDLQAIINSAATATQAAEEASASAAEAAESARTLTIDPTLTQSGQAADSGMVGNGVGISKLILDRIGWVTDYGIFDTSATNYKTSDYVQTGGNRHFRLIGAIQPFYTTNAGVISCFDVNKVFIGFALQILSDDGLAKHDFTVLDDTAYICVTTNKWTPVPSLCPIDWINTTDLYSYHNPESYKIYYGDAQLVNTGKCLKPDLTVVNISAFNMSDPILCDGATQVTVLNAGDNSYYGVAFFTDTTISNDNFLRGIKFTSGITPADPLTISVPKAAKYVVFSARANFRAYVAYDYTHFNSGSIVKKVEGITNFADAPFKIVLGGDSITAGQGGTGYSATGSEIATIDGTTYRRNDNGYCWANSFKSYIESNYNATVTNNGISGMDSSFWNLNKSVLIPADTDLFILMIGANDRHSTNVQNPATLRLKLTRYYNNLYEIIRYCDANNIKIILMSPIPSSHDNEQNGDGYVRVAHEFQWNGVITKLAAFYGMEYINLYNRIYMYALTRNENFESYLTDGLHPNDTGYRVMYYQILDGLGLAPHFDPIT